MVLALQPHLISAESVLVVASFGADWCLLLHDDHRLMWSRVWGRWIRCDSRRRASARLIGTSPARGWVPFCRGGGDGEVGVGTHSEGYAHLGRPPPLSVWWREFRCALAQTLMLTQLGQGVRRAGDRP